MRTFSPLSKASCALCFKSSAYWFLTNLSKMDEIKLWKVKRIAGIRKDSFEKIRQDIISYMNNIKEKEGENVNLFCRSI